MMVEIVVFWELAFGNTGRQATLPFQLKERMHVNVFSCFSLLDLCEL